MKKQLFILSLFAFISSLCWSQDYKKVDAIVLKYPKNFSSPTQLAQRISSDFSNDFDKVRAVYTWIADNIAYDPSESRGYDIQYSSKAELEMKIKKSDAALAARVLSKKKAVCQGYSTLFKIVCEDLNIASKMISGSAKTRVKDIGKKYYSDHAWNIINIKNKEYLIDVTWGAGTYSDHFEKKMNHFYFLTDPDQFLKKHYPDNYENALLQEKIGKQAFLNAPLIYDYDYQLLQPTSGIIKKGKIKFRFLTTKKVNSINYTVDRKNHKVATFDNNNYLEFEIDLSHFQKERELVLFFDYNPIIGFKLE